MINIKPEALNRYALLMGFVGLLFIPLMVVLISEQRCPPDSAETVNVPRDVNNAAYIAFTCYVEDRRILIHIPADEYTYLGRYGVTREDLVAGIKKVKQLGRQTRGSFI